MSYANVNVRIGIIAFFLCLAEKKTVSRSWRALTSECVFVCGAHVSEKRQSTRSRRQVTEIPRICVHVHRARGYFKIEFARNLLTSFFKHVIC